MAQTPSNMIALGTKAPSFVLPDTVSERMIGLADVQQQNGFLVMFICNHCPYVKHVNEQLVQLANDYLPKGIGFVAISSNDVENYPDDAPDKMKSIAQTLGYPFPYLYDESQEVAKAYDAACTPDFYLFDGKAELVYRGRLDESRPSNGLPVTGKEIRIALDKLLAGQEISDVQYPSIGCNIKWK